MNADARSVPHFELIEVEDWEQIAAGVRKVKTKGKAKTVHPNDEITMDAVPKLCPSVDYVLPSIGCCFAFVILLCCAQCYDVSSDRAEASRVCALFLQMVGMFILTTPILTSFDLAKAIGKDEAWSGLRIGLSAGGLPVGQAFMWTVLRCGPRLWRDYPRISRLVALAISILVSLI